MKTLEGRDIKLRQEDGAQDKAGEYIATLVVKVLVFMIPLLICAI